MEKNIDKNLYIKNHNSFFDKIIIKNRSKMLALITNFLKDKDLFDVLDVGSTSDLSNESSNFLIKNLKNFKNYKSISDQKPQLALFSKSLKKLITENLTDKELDEYRSDLVISNATIEHVGSFENQVSFVREMLRISKESVFIQTPNRLYPLDFHTILPFIHWLPKKIHRKILKFLKKDFYSKEENLNLLTIRELKKICKILNISKYKILKYKLFFFTSNLILVIYK